MIRIAVVVVAAALAAVPASALGHDESSADLPGPAWQERPPSSPRGDRGASDHPQAPVTVPTPGRFELVGHDPLFKRGMNAALAVRDDYAYVGSRTDGTHLNAGLLVVDVSEPEQPEVVHEIGPPQEGNPGESSRELRILPEQDLLMVLNHACSELIHACASPSLTGFSYVRSNVRFYDISGENAARPKLVSTYLPSRSAPQQPHEFFIWNDPQRPGRVLMYSSTPSSERSGRPQLIVTDISGAREGQFTELATWKPDEPFGNDRDNRMHSLSVSNDGRRGYLAYLGGGLMVADFSDFADALPNPQVRLVTPVANRVFWTDPGAHSAVKLPGQDYALTTDEVYGKLGGLLSDHGCPWGWTRFIDLENPERPTVASEYKLPVNDPATCESTPPDRENFSSFSSHNPTPTRNLVFLTWHSGGLQAIDSSDPERPSAAAQFVPEPLDFVRTEDPALSIGRDKVVMWSFPIIEDGLVYVVDVRNGLYILRYHGPFEEEVSSTDFLDGNSNSGDALRFEPVAAE